MAAIAKSGTPSISTPLASPEQRLSGLLAGEAIAAGDACYINQADGKLWRSTGAAANAAAQVDGFAASSAAVGEALSIYFGINFRYGAGLTPGQSLFLSGTTAGGLDTVASTGGTVVIARTVDDTRIYVRKSY
jgi:hypothetical protein